MKMVQSVPPGGNWRNIPLSIPSKRLERIRETGGRTTLYGRMLWDKPSYTITTYFNRPGNGTYIHPEENRLISAREAARIQTFPDGFEFKGSKSSYLKQIGNAVPPIFARQLACKIKSTFPKLSTVVDLFAGCGGMTVGFKQEGFRSVLANDVEKHYIATFKHNFQDTKTIVGDIRESNIQESILDLDKVDILIGGPPCQGFSLAGKQNKDDVRNFLFRDYFSIIEGLKPKIFIMENVPGILTMNNGAFLEKIQTLSTRLGYKLEINKIFTTNYSVPQKRKRVIIIGKKTEKTLFPKPSITSEANFLTVRDAISDLPSLNNSRGEEFMKVLNYKYNSDLQKYLGGMLSYKKFLTL